MNAISLSFMRTDQLCVMVIRNLHIFFWSTAKLGIYHSYIYIYETYVILHAKYSYGKIIYYQSHIKH